MNSPWANVAHITEEIWKEHQHEMLVKSLQARIRNLVKKNRQQRQEPEVQTFYAEDEADVIDILHGILRGDYDEEDNT